ncbi:hypothetical protein GGX14DRAFT_588432 [Mycena pura]|uniref:Uncharacterized protein n=1 Tax=Mycena pura TaxID=153505 RepID=A0AAD6Y489_9AGAR|nr:hypothetical protein GGX14DRAFT_588432 [Mycena pura]
MMRKHPDLFSESFYNFCVYIGLTASRPEPSLAALDSPSNSLTGEATVVAEHGPDVYEGAGCYKDTIGGGDCLELVYRSDALTTPFPKSVTPLNKVWDTVGPQVCEIINAHEIKWSAVNTVPLSTHAPPGEEKKSSLDPFLIWIGVQPGSTSAGAAHDISQQILDLLQKHGVEGVVVEWREAVVRML